MIQEYQFDPKLSPKKQVIYAPHVNNTVKWEIEKLLWPKIVWLIFDEDSPQDLLYGMLTLNHLQSCSKSNA